jgi:hypothetical protein
MNPAKYNIRQRFNHFNNILFDGTLPSNFRMQWVSRDDALGYFRYYNNKPYSLCLSSTRLSKLPQQDSDCVLVHEMTHLKLYVLKSEDSFQRDDGFWIHGPNFCALNASFSKYGVSDMDYSKTFQNLCFSNVPKAKRRMAHVRWLQIGK